MPRASFPNPSMANLPSAGEQVRGYEILGRIGAGGMGVVFHARDVKLGRTVALKFLPEGIFTQEGDKRGLLQEARVVSALDHPNICTIFGLEVTSDGRVFIAMGYYDGGTLASRIARGPVPLPEAVDYLLGIASGLAAAHQQRIVHRDIKPSNILLTQQGMVKIADFGLAKIVSTASETQSAETSGTVAYMAPEQLRGEAVDRRVDIWAVGVLGAEMIGGRHPFRRDNLAAMAYGICHQAPEIPEEVPVEVRRALYKCLSKDPALRYSSCEELAEDLRQARDSGAGTETAMLGPISPDDATQLFSGDSAGAWADGNSRAVSKDRSSRKETPSRAQDLRKSIAAAAGHDVGQTPARSLSQRKRFWAALAGGIAATAAILVLAVPALRQGVTDRLNAPAEKHIAVLPFEDSSGNASDQALARGLVESLTGALSNLDAGKKSLWVVPSSVVRSEKVTDPAAAFKLLDATLVVLGSISRSGERLDVTADLINAETLRQVGSASASSSDGDIAQVEQQVLSQLGKLLHVDAGAPAPPPGGPGAPAAYELYLEALGYIDRFDKSSNLDLAIERLRTAVAGDPSFALGYETMGEAYRLKYRGDNDTKWLAPAQANAETAIKLDPRLASAYVTLGDLHVEEGHRELGCSEFQKALDIDDRNSGGVNGLAWCYAREGNAAKAEATYKRAIELRPGYWSGPNELGLFYNDQGRFSEAIAQVKRALEITPDNPVAYFNLGAFYLDEGNPSDFPAAEEALRKSLSVAPGYQAYTNLALLYLHEKRYGDAVAMSEEALALNDRDPLTWVYEGLAYSWLGETAKSGQTARHVEKLAEAALAVNPNRGDNQSFLGVALAQQGMKEKARPHLQAALAVSPKDSQVVVNVVEAYAIIGDDAAALRTMQQARQQKVSLVDLPLDPGMQKLLAKTGGGT